MFYCFYFLKGAVHSGVDFLTVWLVTWFISSLIFVMHFVSLIVLRVPSSPGMNSLPPVREDRIIHELPLVILTLLNSHYHCANLHRMFKMPIGFIYLFIFWTLTIWLRNKTQARAFLGNDSTIVELLFIYFLQFWSISLPLYHSSLSAITIS